MSERIHFGSIEEKERARLAAAKGLNTENMGSAAIQAAIKAGNINIAGESGRTEVLELTETSKEAQEKQAALLRKLEAEKRKRQIYVPTNPQEVISTLRSLGQPVTLFGETVADRRERLREYMATAELEQEDRMEVEGLLGAAPKAMLEAAEQIAPTPSLVPRGVAVKHPEQKDEAAGEHKKELFYTVGSEELVAARRLIAEFSFKRAPERLARLRQRREVLAGGQMSSLTQQDEIPPESKEYNRQLGEAYDLMRRLEINQSQLGDDRPLAAARVSPQGHVVATGSWTSNVKVWDLSPKGHLQELATLTGHTERITGLAWMPQPGEADSIGMDTDGPPVLAGGRIATASADCTAKLWDVEKRAELQTFTGHAARLALVEFHPSGRFIGTTSWDYTWRLWDVETGKELLLQDGHYRETHALAFQPDGALAVTGDYAGVGHVWDLRSGKSIWALQGHANKIVTADFHPDGYQVATGSAEHLVKVWDLRKKKDYYTLPAHSALISSIRFSPRSGEFLATASFDNLVKVWSTRDWRLLKQLEGHELRVVAVDWTPDEKRLVTAAHDRTFKLWADAKDF